MNENIKTKKALIIEKYNPQWSAFFEKESQKIKAVMGENAIEIYHVGSTSVPFLSAKPIIDMLLVTKDLKIAQNFLTSKELGYRYKGEYNLPLRDLYGKKDDFEIYLHVHLINNPEIELNLSFRDYLRHHKEARRQYELVKLNASREQNATDKTETGITQYNLLKNDVIVSILKETGFSGVCPRFVTQNAEFEFFNKIKENFFNNFDGKRKLSFSEQNTKKIILYKGVDLVGAAEISGISSDKFLINFAWTNDNGNLLKMLLCQIADWIKIRTKSRCIEAAVGRNQEQIYSDVGFIQSIESVDRCFVKKI